jgi:hypothetical protein
MKKIATASDIPKVGDGATIQLWSDQHACTVIQVTQNGKRIVVQRDKAIRTEPISVSDAQEYTFEPDPNGSIIIASLRQDGIYREVGGTTPIYIGSRHEFYDYSF